MYSLCSLSDVTLEFGECTSQLRHKDQSHFLGRDSSKAEEGRVVDAAQMSSVSMQVTTNQWSAAHYMALSSFGSSNGKGVCHKTTRCSPDQLGTYGLKSWMGAASLLSSCLGFV